MPGVSTSQPLPSAPPPKRCISRTVVVCMPLPSLSRTACVAMLSDPLSVLTSVDLPTPDDPTSATVFARPAESGELGDTRRIASVDQLNLQSLLKRASLAPRIGRALAQGRPW